MTMFGIWTNLMDYIIFSVLILYDIDRREITSVDTTETALNANKIRSCLYDLYLNYDSEVISYTSTYFDIQNAVGRHRWNDR